MPEHRALAAKPEAALALIAAALVLAAGGQASAEAGRAAAAGPPPADLRLLGTGDVDWQPALSSDGRRYVALQVADGRLQVLDSSTGATTAVAVPRACPMVAAGHGQLLLGCRALLVDLATGAVRTIPGAHTGAVAADEFDAIGAQWLWGSGVDTHGAPVDVFVNWHTGARRTSGPHRNVADLGGPGPPNLDDPRLRTGRRCAQQWIYASQAGLQVIAGLRGELRLQRCGQPSRAGRRLDACAGGPCLDVALAGGLVTWSRGNTAFAYRLSGGKTRRWRFGDFVAPEVGDAVEVAQAGGKAVLAVRTQTHGGRVSYRFYVGTA